MTERRHNWLSWECASLVICSLQLVWVRAQSESFLIFMCLLPRVGIDLLSVVIVRDPVVYLAQLLKSRLVSDGAGVAKAKRPKLA